MTSAAVRAGGGGPSEPYAGKLHVRNCAGGARYSRPYRNGAQ